MNPDSPLEKPSTPLKQPRREFVTPSIPPRIQQVPEWEYLVKDIEFESVKDFAKWMDQAGRACWEAVNVEWLEPSQGHAFCYRVVFKRPFWRTDVRATSPLPESLCFSEAIDEQMGHVRFATWASHDRDEA